MNENMQKIENEIRRQEKLRHTDPTTLSEEEKKIQDYLNRSDFLNYTSYYTPLGRKISLQIGSLVRGDNDPHVNATQIEDFWVSTVWMGIDLSMSRYLSEKGDVNPIIFETMIFNSEDESDQNCELLDSQQRYSSIEAAEEGHLAAVEMVKTYLAKKALV